MKDVELVHVQKQNSKPIIEIPREHRKRTLILYTMNEIDGVKKIFDKIPRHLFDQAFVIDNHSTDGTIGFLESRGLEVIQQIEPGRGAALKEALQHATGDVILNLSSDGNEDPATIPKMLEKIDEGYEMVTASRFLAESRSDDSDDPLKIRKLGNMMAAFCVRLLWGGNMTDVTNGLRAFTRYCLERTRLDYYPYEENFQLSIRCAKIAIPTAEVPTIELSREGGIRKANTLRVMISLPNVLWNEIRIGTKFLDV